MTDQRVNLTDRQEFQHKVLFDPLDVALGIESSMTTDDIDQRILEVYLRFYYMGFIHDHGDKCFLMSHLLRRILRLHGIEAHVKQVTMYYTNKNRGWQQTIGEPMNITHRGAIDSHAIVVTKDLILDFSLINPIHHAFGIRAPIALIAVANNYENKEQDFGYLGQATYVTRRPHKHTKHVVYENRQFILELTKQYFEKYRM